MNKMKSVMTGLALAAGDGASALAAEAEIRPIAGDRLRRRGVWQSCPRAVRATRRMVMETTTKIVEAVWETTGGDR
jgi:hypothetical protein